MSVPVPVQVRAVQVREGAEDTGMKMRERQWACQSLSNHTLVLPTGQNIFLGCQLT